MNNRRLHLLALGIGCAGIAIWLTTSLFGYWPFAFGDLSGVPLYSIPAPDNAALDVNPFDEIPLSEVIKDDRPRFRIDAGRHFRIEIGQGSGWHGLNTTRLTEDGVVTLHRMARYRAWGEFRISWVTATLRLKPRSVDDVLAAVDEYGLMDLDRAYHAAVVDGTQWVLWLQQGDKQKSVYCDNRFPEPVIQFAQRLNAILRENDLGTAVWARIRHTADREHEKALWNSIK